MYVQLVRDPVEQSFKLCGTLNAIPLEVNAELRCVRPSLLLSGFSMLTRTFDRCCWIVTRTRSAVQVVPDVP